MIDLQAAKDLKYSVMTGFDSGGMKAAEKLLDSIEKEYGNLESDQTHEAHPRTIKDWQKAIHQYAQEKGWWDPEKPRSFGDLCALFHTEISEAFEEYRAGHSLTEVYENPDKPGKLEGVPVELADLVIRVLDFCGWAGIDLQEVIARKHAFNLTRPFRHGGKVV